jgi:hypothetical protein
MRNNKQKQQSSSTAKRSESQPKDARTEGLGTAGLELFDFCDDTFEIRDVLPVVTELCKIADRLQQVRELLKDAPDGRLINSEVKLSASYARLWKMAGFGDKDPQPARPVGRPEFSQSARQKRGL